MTSLLEARARETMEQAYKLANNKNLAAGEVFQAVLQAKQALEELLTENQKGPTPHKCLNPECVTIEYGTGYDACPRCGGTEGRVDV